MASSKKKWFYESLPYLGLDLAKWVVSKNTGDTNTSSIYTKLPLKWYITQLSNILSVKKFTVKCEAWNGIHSWIKIK